MTEAELLAAIIAAPGDADARAVYADWLEERGDLRGEYLRLEALLHAGPARLRALRSTLDPAWLASVTRHHDVMLFAGGHDKIAVIKLVREVSGLGLKDAKDLVEGTPCAVVTDRPHDDAQLIAARLRAAGAHADVTPTQSEHLDVRRETPRAQVVWLIGVAAGQRIEAIRSVREVAGLGLAEAKALIDAVGGGERRSLTLEGLPADLAERVAHLRRTWHVEI